MTRWDDPAPGVCDECGRPGRVVTVIHASPGARVVLVCAACLPPDERADYFGYHVGVGRRPS